MLRLVETEGPAALTAERVADAAEISRRTFFNYYPSVDALIATGAGALLERIADALADRPDDEPLADSVIQVIDQVVTVELLSAMVRIWRAVDSSPSASRYALEALSTHNERLAHDWARQKLARAGVGSDSLRESVVMGAYGAAFEEARRHWLRRHDGPIDAAARADFLADVERAFAVVRPITEST